MIEVPIAAWIVILIILSVSVSQGIFWLLVWITKKIEKRKSKNK